MKLQFAVTILINVILVLAFAYLVTWFRPNGKLANGGWRRFLPGAWIYRMELRARDKRQAKWSAVIGMAVKEIEDALLKPYPGFQHTTYFGAMGISPAHLAIWCFFKSDADLKQAKTDGLINTIQDAMRESLRKHGYPRAFASKFSVSFATDDEVQRDWGGNYWQFLK